MSKILRCGVCGLGRIGWAYHIPAILATSGLELTAVADPLEERLTEAKETFGVKNLFSDWKAMADPGLIDLAIIASPNIFHREQTEYFLSRNIDVFCDKPMALSLAEARSMAETAEKYGRKLMVYQPHRITGTSIKAREIIASGKLGKIYQIRRNVHSFVRRNDWQAFTAQGGGMLNNYGAHFIDQLLYVGGDKKAESIRCETARLLSVGDAEDFVAATFRGTSGITYRLMINMATTAPVTDMEICGTHGTAVFKENLWSLKYCSEMPEVSAQTGCAADNRRYPPRITEFAEEQFPNPNANSFDWYSYARDFFNGSSAPFVPLEETLELMRILQECRKSAELF